VCGRSATSCAGRSGRNDLFGAFGVRNRVLTLPRALRGGHNDPVTEATASAVPAAVTDRILRYRGAVVGTIAIAGAVVGGGRGDWDQFVRAGRDMFGRDGLRVYLFHPATQTGPLSLVLARVLSVTPRDGFVVAALLCLLLGLGVVAMAEVGARMAGADRRLRQFRTLVGGSLLMFTWGKLGGYGHLDDAIVLACAAGATLQLMRRRPWWAAGLLGVAIAAKPWAVILLPLLLVDVMRDRPRHWRSLLPAGATIAIATIVWLPFIVASPGISHALRPTAALAPDSVLAPFGFTTQQMPDWLRLAQFAVAIVVGVVLVARHRWAGVLMAAIAVRIATDPATWAYYTPGLVAGALLWDQVPSSRRVTWASIIAVVMLAPTWLVPDAQVRAVLRLAVAVMAVVAALVGARTPEVAPADELVPLEELLAFDVPPIEPPRAHDEPTEREHEEHRSRAEVGGRGGDRCEVAER
jgi:hypothetical protein